MYCVNSTMLIASVWIGLFEMANKQLFALLCKKKVHGTGNLCFQRVIALNCFEEELVSIVRSQYY